MANYLDLTARDAVMTAKDALDGEDLAELEGSINEHLELIGALPATTLEGVRAKAGCLRGIYPPDDDAALAKELTQETQAFVCDIILDLLGLIGTKPAPASSVVAGDVDRPFSGPQGH